jgi:nitrate/TMAO reductase-like tetraheme cytochrome c subunit
MEVKTCQDCQTPKPLSDYYRRSDSSKPHNFCKVCYNDRNEQSRKLRVYGITEAEYERLAANGCNLCGRKYSDGRANRLAVDHCHKTGKVRGVLCRRCNSGIGYFDDDAERLERAAAYIRANR